MTAATARRPETDLPGLVPHLSLHLERTDIRFADLGPGRVGIEVTVWNHGEERSTPTPAFLMAAPLGAFVPWRPLTVLPVPALEPGESFVLRTEARRPAVAPLGPPDRVPPRRLLTALGAEDDRPDTAALRARGRKAPAGVLPADLMDLLRQPSNVYWAGNLNVFVGTRAVERHMAQALRVYPGRVNLAMFVLGGTGRDAYRFHVIGEGEDWGATLHDMTDGQSFALDVRRFPPVVEDRWLDGRGQRMMLLALRPPRDCAAGSVEVHVAQRSSGQSAVVEFSLDPNAAGPECLSLIHI
jgi:hypothetical protein